MSYHCKLPRGLVPIARGVVKSKKQRMGFKVAQVQAFGSKIGRIDRSRNAGAMVPLHPNRVFLTDEMPPLSVAQRNKYNRSFGSLMSGLTKKAKARLHQQLHQQALAEALS